MYVDAVTVAALVDEFNARLLGGRVQAVVQLDELTFGMEVYAQSQRHYLLVSAHPQLARCQLVSDRLRRGVPHPSPLGLLLRKYVDGARLNAVRQPTWERIVWLDFSGEEGDTRLIVEIMDKRSNIILTADDEVLEAVKRIGPDRNRYRVTLPGKPYQPPPPQSKTLPERVTADLLSGMLETSPDDPAWRVLVDQIAGVSPLFAREIVHQACGDAAAPAFDVAGERVHAALFDFLEDIQAHRWYPSVAPDPSSGGYHAFAAYRLTQFEHWQPAGSISEAMSIYFGAPVRESAYEPAKQSVRTQIEAAQERMRRKLAALQRQSSSLDEIEDLRKKGELIYAYAATLEQGQATLVAEYDLDAPPLTIELDPNLTAVENAQGYFARYEKAKRALADVPDLIGEVEQELAYLEQLASDLSLAENWPEIDAVREALQEGGYWQGRRANLPGGGRPGIRRFATAEGFIILAGRNAAQNHALITERAGRGDLWLHARNIPGSHVIIRSDGRAIPDRVIEQAAALAAYYSARRDEARVEVDVTECRYVRPVRGGKPGMVTYRNERTLKVRPGKLESSH